MYVGNAETIKLMKSCALLPGIADRERRAPPPFRRFVLRRHRIHIIGADGERSNRDVLETILSTCYQASLLREEERPVRFRLIVANAASFPAPGGPPHGLQRLLFDEPRPLSHHELRRLAPAVDFHRALIGSLMCSSMKRFRNRAPKAML